MVILREKKEPDLYQALIFYSHLQVTPFIPAPVNRSGYITETGIFRNWSVLYCRTSFLFLTGI